MALFAKTLRTWAQELGASSVHVLFPREDEASLWTGAGYLPRLGFQYHFFRGEDRTFEDYVSRYRSKKRNQIRREVAGPAMALLHAVKQGLWHELRFLKRRPWLVSILSSNS